MNHHTSQPTTRTSRRSLRRPGRMLALAGGWLIAVALTARAEPAETESPPRPLPPLPAELDAPVEATSDAATSDGLAVAQAVLDDEARRIAVMDRAKDAVIAVFAADGGGGGSGVVISPDGFALTNYHVVRPCGHAMKCGMADGRAYDAVLVGIDPVGDVALIRLFGRDDFPTATIGNSDIVRVGDACFAMGNPFMLAEDFRPTATWGIVSGTHRYQYPAGTLLEYTDCLQTDASINPGNSGGPLFDAEGRLIGINGRASFEKRGRVNVGIAYAISINQIKNFLGYLHSGRILDHATLGATVAFDAEGNVVVSDILEQSDAYRRGLRYDDQIVRFAGRPITTPNMFKNVLGIFPRGWRVPLVYRRGLEEREILVRLRGVHGRDELAAKLQARPRARRLIPPDQIPPDGEKPGDENPDGDEPAEEPPSDGPPGDEQPIPQMFRRLMAKKPPVPEIVKQHYEERRGFANYRFNRQHQRRILDGWARHRPSTTPAEAWMIDGTLPDGGAFSLTVGPDACRLVLPGTRFDWRAEGAWAEDLAPPQSGGLFPALYLWWKLANEGPDALDEVYYLGTAPLPTFAEGEPASWPSDRLVDVLVVRHQGIETRLSFDPDAQRLRAVEFFGGGEDADPCEIYLEREPDASADTPPARLRVREGGQPYAVFQVDQWETSPAPVDEPNEEAPTAEQEP